MQVPYEQDTGFPPELVRCGGEHTGRDLGLLLQQIPRQSFSP